jgi:hypothetical protein
MVVILRIFFREDEHFDIFLEKANEEVNWNKNTTDATVLKIISLSGYSLCPYDYCLVKSKKPGTSWSAAESQLRLHCLGIENEAKKIYDIVQVGLQIQFFQF